MQYQSGDLEGQAPRSKAKKEAKSNEIISYAGSFSLKLLNPFRNDIFQTLPI